MLTIVATLILLAIAVPNTVIAVELFAGLKPRPLRLPTSFPSSAPPTTAVLIPAHDEAAGIAAMLAQLLPIVPPRTRVLVVADNCTDATAAQARAAGVEVVERIDASARGKGHALAFGRAALAADPPEVVIVLDADCLPDPGSIERLAHSAAVTGRAVQSANLLRPEPAAGPMVQISGFAFLVKNLVRQTGLARLGVPAILTGTGMAMPWSVFGAAPLATDDIVEDLSIGIALARAGVAARFDPAAHVWSAPAGMGVALGQRTRWEHGFMKTARAVSAPLVAEGIGRGRPGLAWLGLHVAVPPLALLLGIDGAALALIALTWLIGAAPWPLIVAAVLVGMVVIGVLLAWVLHGRSQVGAAALVRAPLYLLWKLPIYLKLVGGAETRWIRTERP